MKQKHSSETNMNLANRSEQSCQIFQLRQNNGKKLLNIFFLAIGFFIFSVFGVKAQQLYVGANYHPHDDKNIEKIKSDIKLMKAAGLNVVRMGHLAWDSYEPAEGQFDFECSFRHRHQTSPDMVTLQVSFN